MSLPKEYRITQDETFGPAFKAGKPKVIGPLKVYKTEHAETKMGAVVPKKALKLSTDRQRLRRRIHELLRQHPLAQTMLVVQVTQKISPEYDLSALKSHLEELQP